MTGSFRLPFWVALWMLVSAATSRGQQVVDDWKFTLNRPADGWQQADFDAGAWTAGRGGFGTRSTPGARVGTRWVTEEIWLRKTFELTDVPAKPGLLIHHDEDVDVYINGRPIASLKGWTTKYELIAIQDDERSALRTGTNVMAVRCRQNTGGQFIDVHLVDANNVPKLPPVPRSTTPFYSELITEWGAAVTPDNAWTEYPRPQLRRTEWQNLNGNWDYAVTPIESHDVPAEWDGQILVPFCLESRLGGAHRVLLENETLWYHRTFNHVPVKGRRSLLNFEAVDYRCQVFVNGTEVGAHRGGNTPFAFDVTSAIRAGENRLIVRVEDETEGYQLRGKQVKEARGIWYTQVSGIWQTVWLESVPSSYINDLTIETDADRGTISVRTDVTGDVASVEVVVKDGQREVGRSAGSVGKLQVAIDQAKLWSPASPHLYDLEVSLLATSGDVIDRVQSYAGIRSVGKQRDADGHLRFTLNGKPIFHWGPLDQGWWPDGLLTPPSDEAMLFDIEYLKAAGFNMIRKHIKVEPRRYYYHCDRLGVMVWQDQVSAGNNPEWTRLRPNPSDAEWPNEHHQQFMVELESMVDTLESHPCIVVWVPFNEAWGQHRTVEVGQWIVKRDPSRLVNIASGGNFWPVGDIVDHHNYPHPTFEFDTTRYHDFIKVMGEFGGHGYPVKGHLWNDRERNWGYGELPKSKEEYLQRYQVSIDKLDALRRQGIAAGVYTQTTDVEGEINGLMTYDRKVIKIPASELSELHRQLFR